MPPSSNPNRIQWIDLAKVVGAIMVIYSHSGGRFGPLLMSFAMPFFFAASGYFIGFRYRRKGFESCLSVGSVKLDHLRFLKLIVATVFWGTTFVLVIRWDEIVSLFETFDARTLKSLVSASLVLASQPKNGPLWFLRDLAFLSLFAPVLFQLRHRTSAILLLGLLAMPAAPYLPSTGRIPIPVAVPELINGLFFFWLGLLAGKSFDLQRISSNELPFLQASGFVAFTAAAYGFYCLSGSGYAIGIAIAGLMSFCLLAMAFEKALPAITGIVAKAAGISFLAYAMHRIVLTKLEISGVHVVGNSEWVSITTAVLVFLSAYVVRLPFFLLGARVRSYLIFTEPPRPKPIAASSPPATA